MAQKNHSQKVKKHFDHDYISYDNEIRKILPFYSRIHKALTDCLAEKDCTLILDLGVGTGYTSKKILKKFPKTKIIGIDISEKMLGMAKLSLGRFGNQVILKQTDMKNFHARNLFTAIIGTFSIHHLSSQEKASFFKKANKMLRDQGVFIIADLVTPNAREKSAWRDFLIKNWGEKEANRWINKLNKEDLPDTLENQEKWLKEAGFSKTKVMWQRANFALLKAEKNII